MVTIVDYKQRETAEGKAFFVLVLQGEVEVVQSSQTGKFYATAQRLAMPSTLDEPLCKQMVGKTLPGTIKKVKAEPYDYRIPDSDETIRLDYTYSYLPEEVDEIEREVFEDDSASLIG